MTASFKPAGAAEFPNDNPALHHGARWVCGATRGPARALWRASGDVGTALPVAAATPATSVARPPQSEPFERAPAPAAPQAPPPRLVRCLDGPLQLDLHRIVLGHRVEDVPPPPDFIYRPLASRAPAEPPAPSSRAIEPRPCRVVDTRQAGQRVERGWRVDVAPCVPVGGAERRPTRHRGGVVACPAPRLPSAVPELRAASA